MFVRFPPAANSAAVTVWLPVHVIVAPGASVAGWVGGQGRLATLSSVTATSVRVTLPVLVAMLVYVMIWPAVVMPVVVELLSIVRDGFLVPVVVTLSQALAAPPAPSSTQ